MTSTLKNRSKKVMYVRNKAYLCAGLVAILEYTEQPATEITGTSVCSDRTAFGIVDDIIIIM